MRHSTPTPTPAPGRSLLAAALTASLLLGGAGTADAAATASTTAAAPGASAAAPKGRFGPFGYRGVKLGMSAAKARATGKISRVSAAGTCSTWRFRTPPRAYLGISKRLRAVAYIEAPRSVRTPRGIGIGSTRKQMRQAYPKVRRGPSGVFYAPLPRNPKGDYVFVLSGGRIKQMVMTLDRQDCGN
ncbi:hypothetical protein [Planomonospora sp. ID82291]|uniref:hypothetical protein n=1 Tax=Planomonospora sp. ID82291 TaxID=2738136 RepID=UPI0018C40C04|nr:hypothetical protein [Planomonospora sp. ID82291]MBG0818532.1 hypothetical protein [Planomonospora sp. ID82291]